MRGFTKRLMQICIKALKAIAKHRAKKGKGRRSDDPLPEGVPDNYLL